MSPDTKVENMVNELRNAIKRGDYGVSGRLPSITQIAETHQVARTTVYQVMSALQNEGLVLKRGNSFYANHVLPISTNPTPTFEQVLSGQGSSSSVKNVIEPEIIAMPEDVAAIFGQPVGLHVIHRYRVQGKTDVPYRLSEYWYPVDLARAYLQRMKDDAGYDTLTAIKHDLGITKQTVHDDVLSRLPTKNEAALLSTSRGVPVQEVRRTNRSLDGKVLMHHRIVFVGPFSILGYDYELAG